MTVSRASPTITTTPIPTSVDLGVGRVTLTDTATLVGGYHPTGTITFTLFYNGGNTPVDTESVIVNGNGSYTTPIGFTLPATGSVTGTYQWDATYGGDLDNNTASDKNALNEVVTVSGGRPTLTTVASPAAVTLGPTAPPILNDTADLENGFNPNGTITFTLFHNGSTTPVMKSNGQRAHQRQRLLQNAERLHPADHRHGDRHLPVDRQFQRFVWQQLRDHRL